MDNIISAQTVSDPFYPTNAELKVQLQALANDYSKIVQYKELGYSTYGNLPIMALKISDNVSDVEDEPVWVFTGFLHGNEQIGLRILLDLANELTSGYGIDSTATDWINAYEIWLVMSLNPWGYEHGGDGQPSVTGTRKNGISTSTSNRFTSGVDLNRNFDFQWRGAGSDEPRKVDFRGKAPFSEKETQAIRELYLARKPVFGMSFHQGNLPRAGEIYRPWTENQDLKMLTAHQKKFADWVVDSRTNGPFCEKDSSGNCFLQDLYSSNSCGLCLKDMELAFSGGGFFINWSYDAIGTVDLLAEVSHETYNGDFMHTAEGPQTTWEQTIKAIATEFARNYREAIKSWFQHFLYSNEPLRFVGPGITGHVTDTENNAPISAIIEVEGTSNELFPDRTSDETFGRFWRFLPEGKYVIKISAPGYETWQDTLDIINDVPLTELEIGLKPLSTLVEDKFGEASKDYHLSPVFPNPFNSQIQFELTILRSQPVEITIYNLVGRKVVTLNNDILNAGITNVFKFETGDLSRGIYLLQIRGQYFKNVQKLIATKD